jgi:hypothetical protein
MISHAHRCCNSGMFLAKMSDEAVLCEDITFVKTYKKDTNVKKPAKRQVPK